MYLDHFEFNELPFSITPDTQFFLNQQTHREALNTMLVALKHCEGFIKVIGEVGTGKTLLCRKLLASLNTTFVSVYIPNPYLTPNELKSYIASEISAECNQEMAAHQIVSAIYRRLMQLHRAGKQVVLIVDEAQSMPIETIECLRLLTNLETEKRKLFQVVILGQPELDTILSRTDLRQVKQRIIFSEYLKPLSVTGVNKYISHRLVSAGVDAKIFDSFSKYLIYMGSGGIPRLVNIICHKSLICAYGKGHNRISIWHAAKAIADTQESHWFGKLCAWQCQFMQALKV